MIFAHHKGKGEDSALKASCHSSRNSVCVSLTDRHWFGCDLVSVTLIMLLFKLLTILKMNTIESNYTYYLVVS